MNECDMLGYKVFLHIFYGVLGFATMLYIGSWIADYQSWRRPKKGLKYSDPIIPRREDVNKDN